MRIETKHSLTNEETYKRINGLFSGLQKRYADNISNPQIKWDAAHTQMDFTMEIMTLATNGTVYLKKSQVALDVEVPAIARVFSGQIESMIRQELENILS
ncbi:MAG: polyhydroxyalkanoic acid system family protein [bacterium]|nr:polyhydroxyalkanoic acid system family protein [bacterium]